MNKKETPMIHSGENINKNQSMYMYLKEGCTEQNQLKLIYFEKKFTSKMMFSEIDRVCGYLYSLKVKPGDPIGIALPNMPEAIFTLYGINALGCVANFIHPRITASSLRRLLNFTNTKIIFIFDTLYAEINEALSDLNLTYIVCSISNNMQSITKLIMKCNEPHLKNVFRFRDMPYNLPFVHHTISSNSPAVYIHSGGTTGEPKTVVQSSYSLNTLSTDVIDTLYLDRPSYKPSDGMLMCLPIFHGFGLGVCVHTLLPRAHVVIMPIFRATMAIKLIKKYKISHIAGIPAMYKVLLENPAFKGDMSFLTHVFCGADRLPMELKNRFDLRIKELGSFAELLEGYGLTETTTVFSLNRQGETIPFSQGRPLNGNLAFAADSDSKPLPSGQCGELYLHAKSVMLGYLNDEKSTKATFCEHDGLMWLKTGDYGSVDENGYIFFKERIKRSLKISAVNVFPSEIEELVNTMEEIDEACAVRATLNGSPCTKLLVIVNKKFVYDSFLEDKIYRLISTNLMKYSVPRGIIPVDSLYRTNLGKVDYIRHEREIQNEIR